MSKDAGGPEQATGHPTQQSLGQPVANWAGNYVFRAEQLHRPRTLDELQEVIAAAARVRVLGSRHSFNDIADSAELVSLRDLAPTGGRTEHVQVDASARTVSVGGGTTYAELVPALNAAGLALHNLASLPHISVVGAVATATHGSGVTNGNLATAVSGVELVTADGEVVEVRRGDPDFAGTVVGLGALGAVSRITLDVEPAFEVAQRVFEGVTWEALLGHFDEIMSSGYSVSVFTRWGAATDMIWVKSRTDAPSTSTSSPPAGDLFGAVESLVDRHPVRELDASSCTPQRGLPGPWSERLAHFRAEFTPSTGDELQSEYLMPRRHAVAALEALRSLAHRIRPLLQVCEIRTVAADQLWMSMSCGQDAVAVHFTWLPDQPGVERLLVDMEDALSPFRPRPHWGKLFHARAADLAGRYEHHADFVSLCGRLDPRGVFRNRWLEERVLDV